jgi:hypothetical protein
MLLDAVVLPLNRKLRILSSARIICQNLGSQEDFRAVKIEKHGVKRVDFLHITMEFRTLASNIL